MKLCCYFFSMTLAWIITGTHSYLKYIPVNWMEAKTALNNFQSFLPPLSHTESVSTLVLHTYILYTAVSNQYHSSEFRTTLWTHSMTFIFQLMVCTDALFIYSIWYSQIKWCIFKRNLQSKCISNRAVVLARLNPWLSISNGKRTVEYLTIGLGRKCEWLIIFCFISALLPLIFSDWNVTLTLKERALMLLGTWGSANSQGFYVYLPCYYHWLGDTSLLISSGIIRYKFCVQEATRMDCLGGWKERKSSASCPKSQWGRAAGSFPLSCSQVSSGTRARQQPQQGTDAALHAMCWTAEWEVMLQELLSDGHCLRAQSWWGEAVKRIISVGSSCLSSSFCR